MLAQSIDTIPSELFTGDGRRPSIYLFQGGVFYPSWYRLNKWFTYGRAEGECCMDVGPIVAVELRNPEWWLPLSSHNPVESFMDFDLVPDHEY